MKALSRIILVSLLLIASAPPLPAPIFEEATPTPKAKAKAKQDNGERTAKQPTHTKTKQSPFAPFAGVWTGTVTVAFRSDVGLNVSGTASRTVKIAGDGTVYYGQSDDGRYTGQYKSRASISADGRALNWTYQQNTQQGSLRGTYSLRLIGPNAASYQEDGTFHSSEGNGAGRYIGTLTKQ